MMLIDIGAVSAGHVRPTDLRGDEVLLPLLPAALCRFCLKWGQDSGDSLASFAEQPPALYHRHPHCSQGLGRCRLEGTAAAEAGEEPRADSGLASGRGEVWPWSDSWQVATPRAPLRHLKTPEDLAQEFWGLFSFEPVGVGLWFL